MRLLYPSDTFNPKVVDEMYADEAGAAAGAGMAVSIFSHEDFMTGVFRARPAIQQGESVLYRGWMLSPEDYARLHSGVATAGGVPNTRVEAYTRCHYLPGWYSLVSEFTAETRIYSESADIVSELSAAGWNGCFLKDYVKSLSTDGGSLVRDLADIPAVVARMRKYRGQIEGGLCARRIEEYDPSSERRYFVWQGRVFSDSGEAPSIVVEAASRIDSPFFSVDVARRADGVLRIIELGDGQVSDRKHWSCEAFISMLEGIAAK